MTLLRSRVNQKIFSTLLTLSFNTKWMKTGQFLHVRSWFLTPVSVVLIHRQLNLVLVHSRLSAVLHSSLSGIHSWYKEDNMKTIKWRIEKSSGGSRRRQLITGDRHVFTKVSEQLHKIWVRRCRCGFSSLGSTLATAISLLCMAEAHWTHIDFVHNGRKCAVFTIQDGKWLFF